MESVIGQLCKNTPGPNRQDYYHALAENQTTGDKTVARRVFAEQTRATLFGYELLQRSYKKLAFAENEELEEDNQGVCYWVPASIRREEKVSTDGLSRYSFFVYGGINVQPRINVIPGRNGPLGGNPVGSSAFSNVNAQDALNRKMRTLGGA